MPFDIFLSRTVFFDISDLRSVDAAKSKIRQQIMALEEDPTAVDNPISRSVQLESLKSSTSEDLSSARLILNAIEDLRQQIGDIRVRSRRSGPPTHSPVKNARKVDAFIVDNNKTIGKHVSILTPTPPAALRRAVSMACDELGLDFFKPAHSEAFFVLHPDPDMNVALRFAEALSKLIVGTVGVPGIGDSEDDGDEELRQYLPD